MNLSDYSIEKLESLKVAVQVSLHESSKDLPQLATDLKYWEGEINCAIDDAKFEEERLKFSREQMLKEMFTPIDQILEDYKNRKAL